MKEPIICDDLITTKGKTPIRYEFTNPCHREAKFKVKYISGMRSHIEIQNLCTQHKNALVKRCERVKKITNFDPKLEITEI